MASPETVAASAVAGVIAPAHDIPAEPAVFTASGGEAAAPAAGKASVGDRPTVFKGSVWVIDEESMTASKRNVKLGEMTGARDVQERCVKCRRRGDAECEWSFDYA